MNTGPVLNYRSADVAEPSLWQLHVWLVDSDPPIWRRFTLSNQATLAELHQVLQIVMGWRNSHLHGFEIQGDRYGPPGPQPLPDTRDTTQYRLADLPLVSGAQFIYTYDFGDGWRHQLTVEAMSPAAAAVPTCLDGARACPPEDCGGMWGYEDLLERIDDPGDPDYYDLIDWIGGDFDPEAFRLPPINQQLQALGEA